MAIQTQIIIVGAGPSGLMLANQLLRFGIDFVIIDKKESITDLSKALVVHARSLEIYEQLGLAKKAIERGQIMEKIRILNRGEIRAELPFGEIGKGLSPFPFALILEQSENEKILYESLTQAGKSVRWKTELEGIRQNSVGVTALLKNSNGEMTEVNAAYLVGCDGAGSKTRHLLDIGFEGSTFPRLFYVADVEMETNLPQDTLNIALGGDAFVLLMPMKGEKHWRLIGNIPENAGVEAELTFDEVELLVKELSQIPLDILNLRWFSSYKIHTRHAEHFSVGRCFLAGDAAHVHTPAGGQGMNTGLQDAYNLGWKLAFVLKRFAGGTLLETYHEERIANAIRLLKTTDEAFELATDDEWYLRLFREKIFPTVAKFALQFNSVREVIFPTLSQIGISYDEDFLSLHQKQEHFKIRAGDRFPYFEVGGKSIYDFLNEPKFHLLTFDDTRRFENIGEKFADLVNYQTFPLFQQAASIFGTNERFSVLIRPDNYISMVSSHIFESDLESYFREKTGWQMLAKNLAQ